jgi:hypothetical protein
VSDEVMEAKIEVIDRHLADLYLSKNMVNRNINEDRVNQYVDLLKRGKWQLNGEAIKFNEKGEMIDGQHRLRAIIKSGIPMTTLVIFNVSDDVSIMDRGRIRNITDCFRIEGMSKTVANNTTVAIAKLFYQMQGKRSNVSDGFVRDWLIENQEDIEELYVLCTKYANSSANSFRVKTKTAPMILATYYAKKVEMPIEEISKFIEVVSTGFYDNKTETSAIVLRNDITSGVINVSHNGQERIIATYKIEKALYDFHHGIERKITYKNINKPIYSNNPMFRKYIEQ